MLNIKKNDILDLIVISRGRWERECIGRIEENTAIKVLLKRPFTFSENLIGKKILTATFPI